MTAGCVQICQPDKLADYTGICSLTYNVMNFAHAFVFGKRLWVSQYLSQDALGSV